MPKHELVLIPGLVCDEKIWFNQVDHLGDIANCTIPKVAGSDTISGLANEVLTSAPEYFAVAGFSMGGYVALQMLRQAPNRITRLALLDTSSRADAPEKKDARLKTIGACEHGKFSEIIADMLNVLLHPSRQKSDLARFVLKMADRVGPEAFIRRHKAIMSRRDSKDILQGCSVPVRVICGRQDAMSSVEEHADIAEFAPMGRLSIIEECGHMSPIESPYATSALMRDWLIYN